MNSTMLKNKRKYNEVPVREEIISKDDLSDRNILHYGYGVRHVQMTLMFFCVLASFIATSQVPIVVVAMTSKSKPSNVKHTEEAITINNITTYVNVTTRETGKSKVTDDTDNIYRTYDWSKSVQEMVMMASIISCCLFTLPMGLLVQRFGGKLFLQLSLIITFVTYIPFPWLTLWGGWKMAVTILFIRGLAVSSMYPAVHNLLAKWVPLSERSRFSSYVYSGTNVGTVIAYQVTGLLAESKGGWPCSFWVVGAFSLFVFVIWTIFGAASPSEDRYISAEEKLFILGRLGKVEKKPRIPWKSILTSKAVYAIFVVNFGSSNTFSFMLVQMPTYVHSILKFNIKNSGLVSSLPHLAKIFSAFFFGWLADLLVNKKILSLRTVRIICTSIGEVGAAICLAAVSFIQDPTWAIFLFITSMGLYSAMYSGWMVNYIDIAPNFTAVIFSIGMTIVVIVLFILPVTISHIITDIENLYQWRTVLLLVAAVGFVCNAVFVFSMSADVQPWNEYDPDDADDTDPDNKNDLDGLAYENFNMVSNK